MLKGLKLPDKLLVQNNAFFNTLLMVAGNSSYRVAVKKWQGEC
jgi:hypothetical protein